jgi:hypothetical protein
MKTSSSFSSINNTQKKQTNIIMNNSNIDNNNNNNANQTWPLMSRSHFVEALICVAMKKNFGETVSTNFSFYLFMFALIFSNKFITKI